MFNEIILLLGVSSLVIMVVGLFIIEGGEKKKNADFIMIGTKYTLVGITLFLILLVVIFMIIIFPSLLL